jgi:hypothetical protein
MIHKMTMVADSAERLRLLRMVLRSPRLNGRICSTPAQSCHPVEPEMDPQAKVQMRREQVCTQVQLGAAQREELQLGAAQHEEVQLLVAASCRTRV